MKKKLLIVLALALCLTLVGCGKTESNNNGGNKQEGTNANNGTTQTNSKYEYNYVDGKLTQIVDEEGNPKQTDFVIDGIILVGNRHEYRPENSTEEIIDYLVKQGYNKEGLNKDFYLGEWIEFYIDTKYSKPVDDVKILVAPHKSVEELEKPLRELSLEVSKDAQKENKKGKTVQLVLKDNEFKVINRSRRLSGLSNSFDDIFKTAMELLKENYNGKKHGNT